MIERMLQNAASVDQMLLLRVCCGGFWSWQWQRHTLALGRGGEWWNQRRKRGQTGRSLISLEMPWLEEIAIWESSWQLMLKIEFDCRGDAYLCLFTFRGDLRILSNSFRNKYGVPYP